MKARECAAHPRLVALRMGDVVLRIDRPFSGATIFPVPGNSEIQMRDPGRTLVMPGLFFAQILFFRIKSRCNSTFLSFRPISAFRDPTPYDGHVLFRRFWPYHRHRFFVHLRRFQGDHHETFVRLSGGNVKLARFICNEGKFGALKTHLVFQRLAIVAMRTSLLQDWFDVFHERNRNLLRKGMATEDSRNEQENTKLHSLSFSQKSPFSTPPLHSSRPVDSFVKSHQKHPCRNFPKRADREPVPGEPVPGNRVPGNRMSCPREPHVPGNRKIAGLYFYGAFPICNTLAPLSIPIPRSSTVNESPSRDVRTESSK